MKYIHCIGISIGHFEIIWSGVANVSCRFRPGVLRPVSGTASPKPTLLTWYILLIIVGQIVIVRPDYFAERLPFSPELSDDGNLPGVAKPGWEPAMQLAEPTYDTILI